MPVALDARSLETIARRIAREPVYSGYADCSQAFADRRALFDHLLAVEAALRAATTAAADADAVLDETAERFDPVAFVREEDMVDLGGQG